MNINTRGCSDEICVVGYALNKKKLRKSGAPVSEAIDLKQGNVDFNENNTGGHILASPLQQQQQQWRGGGLADLLNDKFDTSVSFQSIDFDIPLEEQPFFHVIIHKLTEDIRVQEEVAESKAKLKLLSDYLRHHPSTVLVDPVDAVQHVISRSNVCQVLQQIISHYDHKPVAPLLNTITPPAPPPPSSSPSSSSSSVEPHPHPHVHPHVHPELELELDVGSEALVKKPKLSADGTIPAQAPAASTASRCDCDCAPCSSSSSSSSSPPCPCPFSQPKYLIVEDRARIATLFRASGLAFPVICKPIEACGTPTSHSMVVAIDMDGLSMVTCPSVIQEYKDHNTSFFKVYVMEREVMVYQRPSLPNLQALLHRQSTRHRVSNTNSTDSDRDSISGSSSSSSGNSFLPLKSILFDSRFAYPSKDDFFQAPPSPSPSNSFSFSSSSHPPPSDSSPPAPYSTTTATTSNSNNSSNSNGNNNNSNNGNDNNSNSNSNCGRSPGAGMMESERDYVRSRKPSAADLSEPVRPYTPHQEQFEKIAVALSEAFGLTLFGFDCIIPTGYDKKTVGDSYKEVEDFPVRFKAYLRRRAGMLQ